MLIRYASLLFVVGACSGDLRPAGGGQTTLDGSTGNNTGTSDGQNNSGDDSNGDVTIEGPAQVLAIGDSITAQAASWVYPLQDGFRAAGCEYKMIGHDGPPYASSFEDEREGYDNDRIAQGGFNTLGLWNMIDRLGLGGVPDVVIIYLGVNNKARGFDDSANDNYNPDVSDDPKGAYLTNVSDMIERFRQANPNVVVFLNKVHNGDQDNNYQDIAEAIDQTASENTTAQSPVLAIASATGVTPPNDVNIHPDSNGATTLANKMLEAVLPALQERGACSI